MQYMEQLKTKYSAYCILAYSLLYVALQDVCTVDYIIKLCLGLHSNSDINWSEKDN